MATQNNNLLSAKSLGGNDSAQSYSSIANNGHAVSWSHFRDDRRVVSGAHHVREREQRRHERLICVRANWEKRSICQRNPHRFGLCSSDFCRPEKSAVNTRRLKSVMAKRACAI